MRSIKSVFTETRLESCNIAGPQSGSAPLQLIPRSGNYSWLVRAKRLPATVSRIPPHWRDLPLRCKTPSGRFNWIRGDDASADASEDDFDRARGRRRSRLSVSLKVMDFVAPRATNRPPALAELPPLPPAPRASTVMAPIAVTLSAIRDAADRGAPRNFTGKADNPISQILQNADIGWTASRGPIAATGAQDVLSLATPLTGTLNVTGSLSAKATGAVGDALGGLLGGNVAKQIGSVNIKNLNASAEIKGNVVITARPKIAANWRIEPNLTAQVNLGDTSLSVAGARVNVPGAGQAVDRQECRRADRAGAGAHAQRSDASSRTRGRSGPRPAARSRCRAPTAGSTMPTLWLELRPIRAIAAQPRVDASNRHADARHRGGDPHHAGRDQAVLPVPRHDRHRAADAGTGRDRRAHRHALHRDQQDRGGAVRRKDFSGGWFRLGRRHRQARQRRGVGQPPA